MSEPHVAIYRLVSRIPCGQVATYGQIAAFMGRPRGARQVGYALAALTPESEVPWHRDVNARGRISPRGDGAAAQQQRLLLEEEGISFDAAGAIDLKRYAWSGPAA